MFFLRVDPFLLRFSGYFAALQCREVLQPG
jgi:hypothetical protein